MWLFRFIIRVVSILIYYFILLLLLYPNRKMINCAKFVMKETSIQVCLLIFFYFYLVLFNFFFFFKSFCITYSFVVINSPCSMWSLCSLFVVCKVSFLSFFLIYIFFFNKWGSNFKSLFFRRLRSCPICRCKLKGVQEIFYSWKWEVETFVLWMFQ